MLTPALATLPWELPADLPWRVFTSPVQKWAAQPTFVIGEILFIVLAIAALIHARRSGRGHVLAWLAALLAGTANDVFFMALPLVDNFWQAQAMVMLTPRLPLYIPCVYVCFLYLPTVTVRRLGLPTWPRAALTGLLAMVFYAPYDMLGARFLWWTWHDTDPPIAKRLLDVPAGSTLWVLTFAATFAWLLNRRLDKTSTPTNGESVRALAYVCAFATPLMIVQMTALQQLDGGVPGPIGLALAAAVYAGIAGFGLKRAAPTPQTRAGRGLTALIATHLLALLALAALFDPATHRSVSLHQAIGPCGVKEKDITGLTRDKFLCDDAYNEPFFLSCPEPKVDPPGTAGPAAARSRDLKWSQDPRAQALESVGWYAVCGKPHEGYGGWLGGLAGWVVAGLAGFGLAGFGMAGVGRGPAPRAPTTSETAANEEAVDPRKSDG